MISLAFWTILLCALAGGIAFALSNRLVIDNGFGRKRITLKEMAVGLFLTCAVIVPSTLFIGGKVALSNNLKYHEFWNGYEIEAVKDVIPCTRDGSCRYEYRCDPYTVTHTRSVSDGKGGFRTETYTTTEYHSCPYSTIEWAFSVKTTLGDFGIERTFPDNPVEWRAGEGMQSGVRRGTPPFWQAAHDRIAANNPGPVTIRHDYDNYILASQSSILKKYSEAVETYADDLPAPASRIRDFYYADKAYFVGMKPIEGWNDAVMRFNAAFGSNLQGDLHLVLVDTGVTKNPDEFVGALNAHWTGREFKRDALSKNALVVVLGTDGKTVQWSRAFTGMPVGNEALLADVRREMLGQSFDPSILGSPTGRITKGEVEIEVDNGSNTLESLVWGRNAFERVCMTCREEGGSGFGYLGSEVQPSSGQKWAIAAVAFFQSLLVWAALIAIGSEEVVKNRIRRLGRGVWR